MLSPEYSSFNIRWIFASFKKEAFQLPQHVIVDQWHKSWWRHDLEMLFALLVLCETNPLDTCGFPSQIHWTPVDFPHKSTGHLWIPLTNPLDTCGFPSQIHWTPVDFPHKSTGHLWISLTNPLDTCGFPSQIHWTPVDSPHKSTGHLWIPLTNPLDTCGLPSQSFDVCYVLCIFKLLIKQLICQ